MINNINSYTNLFNTSSSASSTTSSVDEIIAEQKESIVATQSVEQDNANLYLSSRAQKIDSLSREFFSQGELNFTDIGALKERAYELGLISKQDFSHLTQSEVASTGVASDEEESNTSLVSFISDFLERLDETDPTETEEIDSEASEEESEALAALTEALLTAKTILTDIETAKNDPSFKESLTNTLSTLKETINADFFEKIPLDDRVSFTKTYQALDIIDKISPQRLTNDKINQYISIGLT
jgi:hypothetical protein